MKKSLLALAVLGTFAGTAAAQSSVTVYGRLDVAVAKYMDIKAKEVNGRNSRLGFRGVEDLGGGLKAFFHIEHRFDADTGISTGDPGIVNGNPATGGRFTTGENKPFWRGRSVVGLQGGFGQLALGRDYGAQALYVALAADPWGWNGVAGGSPAGARGNAYVVLGGFIGGGGAPTSPSVSDWIFWNNAISYTGTFGGVTVAANIAEANDNFTQVDRPKSIAIAYAGGPLGIQAGWTDQAGVNDDWASFNVSYDFGIAAVNFFFGSGHDNLDRETKSTLVGLKMPLGSGRVLASYAQNKLDGTKRVAQTSIGYEYALSKRTTIYTSFARDSKAFDIADAGKEGYELGIRHNF